MGGDSRSCRAAATHCSLSLQVKGQVAWGGVCGDLEFRQVEVDTYCILNPELILLHCSKYIQRLCCQGSKRLFLYRRKIDLKRNEIRLMMNLVNSKQSVKMTVNVHICYARGSLINGVVSELVSGLRTARSLDC